MGMGGGGLKSEYDGGFPYSNCKYHQELALPQMSGLQQQLLLVDQLRREAAIKRINVGQAVEDLKVMDMDFDRGVSDGQW